MKRGEAQVERFALFLVIIRNSAFKSHSDDTLLTADFIGGVVGYTLSQVAQRRHIIIAAKCRRCAT